jgi:hypothetical protein
MFKLASFILATVISTSVMATTISFKCVSTNVPGIHKFDAHGVVSVDDLGIVLGTLSLKTEKADSTMSAQSFDDMRVEGYIRRFQPGEVSKDGFDQLVLMTNEIYIKSLNLLLDFEDNISSKVTSIDNFSFRSNCKTTATFN